MIDSGKLQGHHFSNTFIMTVEQSTVQKNIMPADTLATQYVPIEGIRHPRYHMDSELPDLLQNTLLGIMSGELIER